MKTIYVVTRVPCDDAIVQDVFPTAEAATAYVKSYLGDLVMDLAEDGELEEAAKWFGNFQVDRYGERNEFIEYVHMGITDYEEDIYVEEHEINF